MGEVIMVIEDIGVEIVDSFFRYPSTQSDGLSISIVYLRGLQAFYALRTVLNMMNGAAPCIALPVNAAKNIDY